MSVIAACKENFQKIKFLKFPGDKYFKRNNKFYHNRYLMFLKVFQRKILVFP